MIVLFEIVLDITTVKLEAVAGGTFKLSTFKIMITIVVGINMSVIIIIIWIMMARDKIIIMIIIIWIMMARWAGDEIMNNPTIKSHIYMGPHPPWIIMMMRVIMITVELQICGIFNLQQRPVFQIFTPKWLKQLMQLSAIRSTCLVLPKPFLLKSNFYMGGPCLNVARICENELQSGCPLFNWHTNRIYSWASPRVKALSL